MGRANVDAVAIRAIAWWDEQMWTRSSLDGDSTCDISPQRSYRGSGGATLRLTRRRLGATSFVQFGMRACVRAACSVGFLVEVRVRACRLSGGRPRACVRAGFLVDVRVRACVQASR